jgi:hypothetical protein
VRRTTLFRSITRFLDDGVTLEDAAFMWSRHRWMIPYALVAGSAVFFAAGWVGFDGVATRTAVGFAAGAVAVNATTDYRVLALTSRGLLLLKASRIRQYATAVLEPLPDSTTVVAVGGTVLATDWRVGDEVYTVPRSSGRAIERIAQG